MKKLVIIGNGFDLGHGLPTGFDNFIKSNTKYFEKYKIFKGESWSNIEENYKDILLHIIDNRSFVCVADILEEIINVYGYDEYGNIDYYHYNSDVFDKELNQITQNINLISQFEKDFTEYLKVNCNNKILKTIHPFEPIVAILKNASYIINFNYTEVVELVYKNRSVTHIHGDINNGIAIGTGTLDAIKKSLIDGVCPIDLQCKNKHEFQEKMMYYEEDMEGNLLPNRRVDLFNEIKASVEKNELSLFNLIDQKNKDSLLSRKTVKNRLKSEKYEEVYILGHSLGEADLSVFEKINKDAKIFCYYFKDDEYDGMYNILVDLGFNFQLIRSDIIYKHE